MQREAITLSTPDNVSLAGHWYLVEAPSYWALLLHMMPATKESFAVLAAALQEEGIASLAIDFRGHGASDGGPEGYTAFTDAEQQAKRNDVAAALEWLREQGMRESRLVIVGASIGANLALEALVRHPVIPAAVLLSPGLHYRGLATEPLARQVASTQHVLLAAGGADDAHSTEAVRILAPILGDRATVRLCANAGHGTEILEREPKFLEEVARWINRQFP